MRRDQGSVFGPRNLILRRLMGVGSIAASTSVLFDSVDFKNGSNIFNGAFLTAFKDIFPDFTTDQMNRLSDMAFSASNAYKMVVPTKGSVPFVTFLSQQVFDAPIKKMSKAELFKLQEELSVIVAGVHIQQVKKTTVTDMPCPEDANGKLDLSKAKGGAFVCPLSGTNLDLIDKVRMKDANGKTADGALSGLGINAGTATATFPTADLTPLSGTLPLYLELKDKTEQTAGITKTK